MSATNLQEENDRRLDASVIVEEAICSIREALEDAKDAIRKVAPEELRRAEPYCLNQIEAALDNSRFQTCPCTLQNIADALRVELED